MYKTRHLEAKIKNLSQYAKVILVVGARQVGKSTLLSHIFPDAPHITFDPFQDKYNVQADPDLFLQQYAKPLILDEIQYHPALVSAIKRKVDQSPQPGQYFLTGSQNFSVLKNMAESMAGRVSILTLYPLTPHEMEGCPDKHWLPCLLESPPDLPRRFQGVLPIQLWSFLWRGRFPGMLSLPDDAIPIMLQSYLETYIERDVRLLESIRDLNEFTRFVRIVAALTSQEIHPTQLGRDIGITHTTASRWLNLLTYTYQWEELCPYHGNTLKRLSRKGKGIFQDTGMACHLLRLSSPEALGAYPQMGALFKTSVINQMTAVATALDMAPHKYHWRTSNGAEVDIILERDGWLYPIEVKAKTFVGKQDARGIRAFRETYPRQRIRPGVVIYAGDRCFWIDEQTLALPYHAIIA